MMPMSRSARLLIAGLGALALGCKDAPTEAAPVKGPGKLTLTVVEPDGVEISLWQSLPDGRDMPLPGSFEVHDYGIFGRREMMGQGSVWTDFGKQQALPAQGASSSVTIDSVTADRAYGRLELTFAYTANRTPRTSAISATFVADRATEKKTTSSGDR